MTDRDEDAGALGEAFAAVAARALTRREFVRRVLGGAFVVHLPRVDAWPVGPGPVGPGGLTFTGVPGGTEDALRVAPGHRAAVLLRWGDPVLPGAPPFDPDAQTAAGQARQFGYNCDFVGFMPLPRTPRVSDRGLLVVNHEYTNPELMFRDHDAADPSPEHVAIQLAAHGMTIVEVRRDFGGTWRVVVDGPQNRRITGDTPMRLTGPAAGHALLRTRADPTGRLVAGTLANCSAGRTPWGTILSAEENFHAYFANRDALAGDDPRRAIHARYGLPRKASDFGFEGVEPRFNLRHEPNEAFRFGWVVEVDPYDPTSVPRKRTALGRLRSEGATSVVAPSGQVVFYSGDDVAFEYLYKFVTRHPWHPEDRAANRDLLDEGTLFVARFDHDGTGVWLPLRVGAGRINAANGFATQADVVINPLGAADLQGATRMDRPEDIEVSPTNGHVFVSLTKNVERGADDRLPPDATNPRRFNRGGHVLEIVESGGNHAGTRFAWQIFLLCGDPDDPSTYFAGYPRESVSALACPDNLVFDRAGNLWIATDGQPEVLGINDALYAVPTVGAARGEVRRFLSAPPGAEVTGPEFTPDDRTLFVAIQHPGEGSTLADATSRWPDGAGPPRPSVVAITAAGDAPIGRG